MGRLSVVREQLPVFPLNTVVFPGMRVPLHVFEDRYRALVHHLLTIEERTERRFGIVAIREGFEVGDHGVQSLHRVGCVMQMTAVEAYPDGRFDIETVGLRRLRLDSLDTSGPYLVGEAESVEDPEAGGAELTEEAARALVLFESYRRRLTELRGTEVLEGELPVEPTFLSYALAATCLLPLSERQALLEASTTMDRLVLVRHAMRREMGAMRAVPSLPATEVARTGWSPN